MAPVTHHSTQTFQLSEIKPLARGRWAEILSAVGGVPPERLDGGNRPCPKCGGKDRFRFSDMDGDGSVFCSGGGGGCAKTGDGFETLQWLLGCNLDEAIRRAAEHLGATGSNGRPSRIGTPPVSNSAKAKKRYGTASEAFNAGEKVTGGKFTGYWSYTDVEDSVMFHVARYDKPLRDGQQKPDKDFLPIVWDAGQWTIGGVPKVRPLYLRTSIRDCEAVCVAEGEKCADKLWDIGLPSTTNSGGANAVNQTDWRPLAGKRVYIFSDQDAAGDQHGQAVIAQLVQLSPRPTIFRVHLDGLEEGEDIADWLAQRSTADARTLQQELWERAVEVTPEVVEQVQVAVRAKQAQPFAAKPFKPFPVDVLPEVLGEFVTGAAKSIGCESAYVALPMLSVLAAAIGGTRRIMLKRGWTVPSIIWTATVGESGTQKTPPFKVALRPVAELQRQAAAEHQEAENQFETDMLCHDKAMAAWKRDKNAETLPPPKPERPTSVRYHVTDTTVEALAPLLLANPRGLLLARDELSGWLGSFDRYSSKGRVGADTADWLSMHNGGHLLVDRKTGSQKVIYVPEAVVSIMGGIQPGVLDRALGAEHRESGLAARFLLTCPPRKPKRWTDAELDPDVEAGFESVVRRLYQLRHVMDGEGKLHPAVLPMTPGAKAHWKRFYNQHGIEQSEQTGDLAAAYSKLEEIPARLALVLHCVTDESGGQDTVGQRSMEAGIALGEWFKYETDRVYAMFDEDDFSRQARRLAEWISARGGAVTAREFQQGHRDIKTARDAELALTELKAAGYGDWVDQPASSQGGRPTRVFKLSTVSTSTQPSNPAVSEGFVDVDTVDTPETHPSIDEWFDSLPE